jgi:hypothetical protein
MPLDRGAPGRASGTVTAHDRGEGGRVLRCRRCGHAIARDDGRIEMSGAHEHVLCNPAGEVFGVGCFAAAPGCRAIGPATDFYSWFPGYAWRVGVCGGCGEHLGWSYGERPDFWGIVLARLVEDETEA